MKQTSVLIGMAAFAAVFLTGKSRAANVDSNNAGLISEGDAVFLPVLDNSSWGDSGIIGGIMDVMPTQLSDLGATALKHREGFSATPYSDHKGYSIGYGHLILPNEQFDHIDTAQADILFNQDVLWAVDTVVKNITAFVSQNAFDALVSFCYNVGAHAFATSTLVKRINNGDASAVDEFGRWVYASGVVNDSLVVRRKSEATQFVA